MPTDCPDSERLAAYVEGTLERGEDEAITVHCILCSECWKVAMAAAATLEGTKDER